MSDSLESIFTGVSKKLAADFDFLSSQLAHRPTSGTAREFAIKEVLRQYLPQKLAVGSGAVISSDGQISKQMDIVIYDALNTPILFSAGDTQIFPVECVYAVIEIKSRLNTQELKKSAEVIRSIKQMPKKAYIKVGNPAISHSVNLYGQEFYYFPILGLVFAYNSIKNIGLLRDKLIEIDDDDSLMNIDTICILDKALITNWQSDIDEYIVTNEPGSQREALVDSDNSLLTFYLFMMHTLPQVWMHPIRITDYAQHVTHGVRLP